MVFLCLCGGLIRDNKVHVCGTSRCSCGGIQFDGRAHFCGYKPDYSKPPTDYELWRGLRSFDEWVGSPKWGKHSPSLFNTVNQETRVLNSASSMEEIKNLQQTGSFHDYCSSFDFLLTRVILSEDYATSLFVEGLKPEIKGWVKFLSPKTLKDAYEKAKNQVNLLNILHGNKKFKKVEGQSFSASSDKKLDEIEIRTMVESENGVVNKEIIYQHSCDSESAVKLFDEMPEVVRDEINEEISDETKENGQDDSMNNEKQVEIVKGIASNDETNIVIEKDLEDQLGTNSRRVSVIISTNIDRDVGCKREQVNQSKMKDELSSLVILDNLEVPTDFEVDFSIKLEVIHWVIIHKEPVLVLVPAVSGQTFFKMKTWVYMFHKWKSKFLQDKVSMNGLLRSHTSHCFHGGCLQKFYLCIMMVLDFWIFWIFDSQDSKETKHWMSSLSQDEYRSTKLKLAHRNYGLNGEPYNFSSVDKHKNQGMGNRMLSCNVDSQLRGVVDELVQLRKVNGPVLEVKFVLDQSVEQPEVRRLLIFDAPPNSSTRKELFDCNCKSVTRRFIPNNTVSISYRTNEAVQTTLSKIVGVEDATEMTHNIYKKVHVCFKVKVLAADCVLLDYKDKSNGFQAQVRMAGLYMYHKWRSKLQKAETRVQITNNENTGCGHYEICIICSISKDIGLQEFQMSVKLMIHIFILVSCKKGYNKAPSCSILKDEQHSDGNEFL